MPIKKGRTASSENLTATVAPGNPFEQLTALLFRQEFQEPVSLTEDHIRSVLLVRRARSQILGEHLFSDPAWDILLELYAAGLGGRKMSLAEVSRATETHQSTTKRWIAALEERALVKSTVDPVAKAVWISLTEDAEDRLASLADHWGSAFVSI